MANTMTPGWKPGYPPRGVSSKRLRPPKFDALRATAHELQRALTEGTLNSTDLVEEYVWRIEEHNTYLHAISEYAPGALERAKEMDLKRAAGEILGPLHGIPLILKNSIATHPSLEMDTTAGAAALVGSKPSENAYVVEKILAAGAVILGKSTVSELSFHMGVGLPCGWSAVDGQGQSPYVRGGVMKDDTIGGHSLPGGSSSGLSIAIAAGLAAGGIGSDTEASITAPAVRASLYSLRPTHGIISAKGVIPISRSFDTPGSMAKDVRDVAEMLFTLVDHQEAMESEEKYQKIMNGEWNEMRIGTLDPHIWQYPEFLVKPVPEATAQMVKATKEAYERLRSLAGAYHENINLRPVSDFMLGEAHSVYAVQDAEFEGDINAYLGSLTETKVRTLRELVDWNEKHAAQALPENYSNQAQLINNVNSPIPVEKAAEYRKHYLEVGSDIDNMFRKYGINIIVAPGDCFFTQFSSATSYPLAALPLGYLDYNGRPIGLQAMAAGHNEELLLKFMHLFETAFPPRQPPTAFQDVHGSVDREGSSL